MRAQPDSFQIVSTFGIALDTTPSPTGGYSYTPFHLLPNTSWEGAGSGTQPIDAGSVSGIRGTIEIQGFSGNAASLQSIFDLSLTNPPGVGKITVRMTAGRKLTVIHQDLLGNVVAQVLLTKTYTVNTRFSLRYIWDSRVPVLYGRHAAVFVNDEFDASATWVNAALVPWTSFVPAYASINAPVAGTVAFAGTIDKVQVSDAVLLEPDFTTVIAEQVGAHLYPDSAMTAAAKMRYVVGSSVVANSAMAGTARVSYAIASAIVAGSTVVANVDP